MLTLQALTYIIKDDRIDGPIWNYATGTLTVPKYPAEANRSASLNSTTRKCAPMQVFTTGTWESFNRRGICIPPLRRTSEYNITYI